MNKMRLILLLTIVGMITACHTDYLNYEEPKDMIYVSAGTYGVTWRSITYFQSWEYMNPTKSDGVGFKVAGFPADVDREIGIVIVDSLTTAIEGQDYVLNDKIVMPAGEIYVYVPMIVWNQRKPEDTRSDTLKVGFCLVENEHFALTELGGTHVQFQYWKTKLTQPRWWEPMFIGPWSEELMSRFIAKYDELETTHPDVYKSIYNSAGAHFSKPTVFWPYEYEYLITKFIIAPLYYYYQENPVEGVDIPKPKYE